MFALPGKNLKIWKMSLSVTITVSQCSMQFFPSLLFKNDQILRNDGLFSSKNFKRLHHLYSLNWSSIF